jgi:hypothetical protein
MSEIDDATVANQFFGGTAIGDGNEDAARVLVLRFKRDTNFGAEWIKPGSSSQLIGIKSSAVGHESPTMILAIPRGHSGRGLCVSAGGINEKQKQQGPEHSLHSEYNHCWS